MKIMVLNDGETYTDLDGCSILELPDGTDGDEIEDIIKNGVAGDDYQLVQRWGRGEEYAPGMVVSFTDANATVSDHAPGVATGTVNGPPVRNDYNEITHVPVFAKRDKGREATTIYVAVENMLGEVQG
jgi:hypothetical protein